MKLKRKARVANMTANGLNALINWQPFNMIPFTSMYNWANKVRTNDPAWDEFMERQIQKSREAALRKVNGESESGPIQATS